MLDGIIRLGMICTGMARMARFVISALKFRADRSLICPGTRPSNTWTTTRRAGRTKYGQSQRSVMRWRSQSASQSLAPRGSSGARLPDTNL